MDYQVMSSEEWNTLDAPEPVLKKSQVPDLRIFTKRRGKVGWKSRKTWKTKAAAERFITQLDRQHNRPQVGYYVFELPEPTWDGDRYFILALPREEV